MFDFNKPKIQITEMSEIAEELEEPQEVIEKILQDLNGSSSK